MKRATPLRRTPFKRKIRPTADAGPRKRKRRNSPRTIPRSLKYLNFIRTLPCLICGGVRGKSEAAHTGRTGGMGIKASDFDAVPLCAWNHTLAPDSYHAIGEKEFCRRFEIDLQTTIERLNQRFGRKP